MEVIWLDAFNRDDPESVIWGHSDHGIIWTNESFLRVDSSNPFMCYDLSDLVLLIQIIPMEHIQCPLLRQRAYLQVQ